MPQGVDRERPRAQWEQRGGGATWSSAQWSGRLPGSGTPGPTGRCGHTAQRGQALVSHRPHFLPCPPDDSSPADIFAVGFEEMVELSAGNIVNAR